MNIQGFSPTPIAPAPEQVADARKIETKPKTDDSGTSVASAPAPQAVSRPADPDGAGKLHAVA